VKLYLDENLSPRLAEILRARGLEVVGAYEVGNAELDDRAQLASATREDRAIVTCDIPDFTVLAADALAANTQHAGILISSRFGRMSLRQLQRESRQSFGAVPGAVVVYVTRPAC
jgi:predicted nuclease of predicted toxin-antitoxin system